jgi:hypothetical protein
MNKFPLLDMMILVCMTGSIFGGIGNPPIVRVVCIGLFALLLLIKGISAIFTSTTGAILKKKK